MIIADILRLLWFDWVVTNFKEYPLISAVLDYFIIVIDLKLFEPL